jgi:hypothetical protein
MTVRGKNQNDMPAVPDPDFVGALCEIWFAINYAAYHLAYVRVYLQTEALQHMVTRYGRLNRPLRRLHKRR